MSSWEMGNLQLQNMIANSILKQKTQNSKFKERDNRKKTLNWGFTKFMSLAHNSIQIQPTQSTALTTRYF